MDLVREIWQTITNNKLRTALTGLAVSWGIFMLIVLIGMARGVINSFESDAMSSNSNNLIIGGGWTTEAHGGYAEGRDITLQGRDAEPLKARSEGYVSNVSVAVNNDTASVSTRTESSTGGYSGVEPKALQYEHLEMASGRFINDFDVRERRKVMVLSSKMADMLFGDDDPVGERVTCMDLTFTVIGVYDHRWSQRAYIPLSTARMLDGDSDDVSQMTATLQNVNTEADGEQAEQLARQALASAHNFSPNDNGAVWVWNQFTQHLQIASNMSLLETITWVIGVLTLLTGIIGVSNIMFVSVRERRHEIGVRRAIGARPRNILTQVVLESVAITAIFGYIGIVAGIGVLELINLFLGDSNGIKDPGINMTLAFEVTVVLIVAGAVAGIAPALKALKVKPVEALRDE